MVTWITSDLREKNLLLLDMEFDKEENGCRRLDLQIAFNPISFTRNGITLKTYYIATTGAMISLSLDNGNVLDYTKINGFKVKYDMETARTRLTELSLSPSLENENGGKLQLGSIHLNKSNNRRFITSFEGYESELATIPTRKSIKWILNINRGEKIVRDYLAGTLHLYCLMMLEKGKKHSGDLIIRPTSVDFYNSENKRLNNRIKVLMYVFMEYKGFKVFNKKGLVIRFEEFSK